MVNTRRSWDLLSEDKRKKSIRELIDFINNESNEEIGIIAAERILDYFLQTVGIQLYNKGIIDSINLMKDRFENMELDLESLQKESD
ncbi:DUF2164 domain-containing protein [Candidatus Woesearchaeota archaeon]|nr:DUF2164 domain-containing protein [Candidatus Woesearchaeota archaeon]